VVHATPANDVRRGAGIGFRRLLLAPDASVPTQGDLDLDRDEAAAAEKTFIWRF
jgi:hypothetical protein